MVKDAFEGSYGDQLSPNEKVIYDAVAALPVGTQTVTVTLPEIPAICKNRLPTEEEKSALSADISSFAANALYAAWLDFPTLFWLDHSHYSYDTEILEGDDGVLRLSKLTFRLELTASLEEVQTQNAKLEQIMASFKALGVGPAEKVAYINSYLCARIEYDLDAENRGTLIGALVDGKCVCEGYARAFDYLCEKAGIDAVCIPGYGKTTEKPDGEGHMWNAVRINGKLYAVDATWNDTTKKNSYLLVGTDTVCNESPFGQTHKPDMLTLEGPYKVFALPAIEKLGYGTNP